MGQGKVARLERKETYWGSMEYVHASTGLALKRMFMRAGTQSSLEFHVQKHEIYWIIDGVLRLELRDGQERGRDSYVNLGVGDCYEIPPGVMHRRKAVTDVVILEACSYDGDEDTYIVEDGRKS